jgi:hypothetical protein
VVAAEEGMRKEDGADAELAELDELAELAELDELDELDEDELDEERRVGVAIPGERSRPPAGDAWITAATTLPSIAEWRLLKTWTSFVNSLFSCRSNVTSFLSNAISSTKGFMNGASAEILSFMFAASHASFSVPLYPMRASCALPGAPCPPQNASMNVSRIRARTCGISPAL